MRRMTVWFIATFFVALTLNAQTPVNDPVPSIENGDLEVSLKEWVTVPKSNNSKPFARINMLREMPDGTGRLAVNDLNGPLYIIEDSNSVHKFFDLDALFPDLQHTNGKGSGFGGFAFHPDYETNGILFTTHAEVPNKEADFKSLAPSNIQVQWVLTRWTVSDPSSNTFSSGSKTELARWDFPTVIHGVQEIAFNPFSEPEDADYGMLYICIGEGGSGLNRLHLNMQNTSSHLGTIWRIDPLGTNSITGAYGIPEDNPFVGDADALGEIWAYGFRNPHRLHFEKRNDDVILFTGDIGELNIEEVNLIEKGGNYGWDRREGTFMFDIDESRETLFELPADDDESLIYPVAQYDHDDGLAINLGHVWHADRVPEFKGIFFMGDIPTGRIFYAPVDSLKENSQYPLKAAKTFNSLNEEMSLFEIVDHGRVDIKFGEDSSGEVYFLSKANGTIYKIAIPGEEIIDTTSVDTTEAVVLNTELIHDELIVYPSPSNGELKVKLSTDKASVSILDLQGRELIQTIISKENPVINVQRLNEGVFIVKVTDSSGRTFQSKFIKQNE